MQPGMVRSLGVLLLVAVALCVGPAVAQESRFILTSSPTLNRVSYIKLERFTGTAPSYSVKPLLSGGLMQFPEGIAVDRKSTPPRLFVADPKAEKVLFFTLYVRDGELFADKAGVLVDAVRPRWVAADGVGNVYFSEKETNVIKKVTARSVQQIVTAAALSASAAGAATSSAPSALKPSVHRLYAFTPVAQVSSPGGVAADNSHVYWANQEEGLNAKKGSVVRAPLPAPAPEDTSDKTFDILANPTQSAEGVCLAGRTLFFSDSLKAAVYGVKSSGGSGVVTVATNIEGPRGCAWDGDGTIYVADKKTGSIFSFPSGGVALSPRTATQVTNSGDFEDAFGVAFMSPAARTAPALIAGLFAVAAAWL